ncbi:MAG: enoyl-CoA hydratase/isomerase family protein [Meiothermus sp.]|uniref:enoyl-CoA hydratase/isomerase family protein n=1 Tax=Meiothermus sp. TaxID=1955249 RepID=UPI0025FAF572|nr:enoyl-CoA hydratase/isomerase family protein [Meiothermus sp.]MCS7067503.1 enoyl-CoA hydratase/isomerase family protein [Meiothermus sp.]MCX7601731.1 enoyl-CoA hydratase/isomerase family protein [Meiothermus sp.]MDW8424415.1 enoyl-CoA hydratase/isomerase family protein [Meiothermus sp.]
MSVLASEVEGIRLLTLNDPQRRNPLSPGLVRGLLEALEAAEQDPATRAVVLTGAGPAFSAGADLDFLQSVTSAGAEANYAHSRELMRLFHRIYTFPKPTLAAINGPAVAGGAGLATACDLAVMSEDARIGYTEVKIGFVAALVGVILVRNVGEKHAKELLLTGRLVSAPEAYRMGLVNRVVPAEQLLDETLALAREVCANAPTSLSLTKELLHALPGMGLEDGFRLASIANAWVRETGDLAEGIAAFFEKRPPRF